MGRWFWDTKFTIEPGHGFALFGPVHLCWIAALLLLCVLLGRAYHGWNTTRRLRCLRVLTAPLLLDELGKYAATVAAGNFRLDFLPLHICSINIFIVLAYTLHPSERLPEILYAICLPGALAAILFPSWTALPVANFMHLHSFTIHILLCLYPVLLLCGGFRPHFERFAKVLPACLPVLGAVFCLNKVLDTNFMFLNGAGEGNPLAVFQNWWGNPGYLVSIPLILAILWLPMYGLPWLCRQKQRKSADSTPENPGGTAD